ncbi:hypothetical protein NE237_023444 [Protea cynaroides]|uniref:NAC domain-containing protein n=1 Tax=Protea cynaroides TaxID=273540 RepID=A0A9Q0HF33_9MAGN|nr:hypothetical protein NE237_023444 [Protea cynaroides]
MDHRNTITPVPEMVLPGFRFHPTEEELLDFYLKNVLFGKKLPFDIIGFLNIYHHEPWDLPGLAKTGEREWYFFVPRDRKHGHGGRPNRTTAHGFWKATGTDRQIRSLSNPKRLIGLRKTLVFYMGRAPHGSKTDWVMNEYRMSDTPTSSSSSLPKDDMVLCKIYRKATSLKVLEQRAAMEKEMKRQQISVASSPKTMEEEKKIQQTSVASSPMTMNARVSMSEQEESFATSTLVWDILLNTKEEDEQVLHNHDHEKKNKEELAEEAKAMASVRIRPAKELTELQLPKLSLDWTHDSFWTQLRSPWLDNYWALTPSPMYFQMMN